jgi:hypothetical protein
MKEISRHPSAIETAIRIFTVTLLYTAPQTAVYGPYRSTWDVNTMLFDSFIQLILTILFVHIDQLSQCFCFLVVDHGFHTIFSFNKGWGRIRSEIGPL